MLFVLNNIFFIAICCGNIWNKTIKIQLAIYNMLYYVLDSGVMRHNNTMKITQTHTQKKCCFIWLKRFPNNRNDCRLTRYRSSVKSLSYYLNLWYDPNFVYLNFSCATKSIKIPDMWQWLSQIINSNCMQIYCDDFFWELIFFVLGQNSFD